MISMWRCLFRSFFEWFVGVSLLIFMYSLFLFLFLIIWLVSSNLIQLYEGICYQTNVFGLSCIVEAGILSGSPGLETFQLPSLPTPEFLKKMQGSFFFLYASIIFCLGSFKSLWSYMVDGKLCRFKACRIVVYFIVLGFCSGLGLDSPPFLFTFLFFYVPIHFDSCTCKQLSFHWN